MNIFLAFVVLSIIIIVHEFGHFILAKANGVTVTEFSLGMGPRLLQFKKNGTIYSLKLFLFGGACQMLGEDDDNSDSGAFNSKSVWARISIVAAGPIFNFILAFLLAIVIIGSIGYDPCVVYNTQEDSPASEAGLQAGDKITEINGKSITFYGDYSIYMLDYHGEAMDITYVRDGKEYETELIPEHVTEDVYQLGVYLDENPIRFSAVNDDSAADKAGIEVGDIVKSINGTEITDVTQLTDMIHESEGKAIEITVERDGEEMTFSASPELVHNSYYNTGVSFSNERVKTSPLGTLKYAALNVKYWISTVFESLKLLITGSVSANEVSGPVGIVSAIGEVVENAKPDGLWYVFLNLANWTVMISANLGVMNLLPLPALDGGRLVFLLIEAVRGKPINREKEGMVHFIGIVLLMILMVVVLFNDVRKLL